MSTQSFTGPDLDTATPPADGSEAGVYRADLTAYYKLSGATVEIENPIDGNEDGQVNDFPISQNGFTGNAFGYDRATTNLVIKCQVNIQPDTEAFRALYTNKITVQLTAISNADFCSRLSWGDHASPSNPAIGILAYDPGTNRWVATATFSNLPAVPSNSWGRVPKGLHDLLYGSRHADFTFPKPFEAGEYWTTSIEYEVYFGDSLRIGGTNMAETTLNFANNISTLVGSSILRREMFEKMNCSTESFSFSNDTKAIHNFDMREYSIANMDWINTTNVVRYYRHTAITSEYPRAGTTMVNTNTTTNWVIGSYWTPVATNPWCWRFVQIQNTMAHDAINNVTPLIAECSSARSFCFLLGADQALGPTIFNSIHDNRILSLVGTAPGLVMHITQLVDTNTLVPGDCVYMQNKYDYSTHKTNNPSTSGLYEGFNCLYMGQNSSNEAIFGALGDNRLTESQMREELRQGYTNDCRGFTVENPEADIRFIYQNFMRLVTGE